MKIRNLCPSERQIWHKSYVHKYRSKFTVGSLSCPHHLLVWPWCGPCRPGPSAWASGCRIWARRRSGSHDSRVGNLGEVDELPGGVLSSNLIICSSVIYVHQWDLTRAISITKNSLSTYIHTYVHQLCGTYIQYVAINPSKTFISLVLNSLTFMVSNFWEINS
jgi:hypothetical protein